MKPGNAVAIALCMAVAVLEGFDIQAMGVAMPRLGPEFGLDADAKGWLFSVNNIGMVLGAAVGGWLADRTGRRPVLLSAVALFGLFTFWVAIAKSYDALVTARFLAGLGFGAALPNMMAIAAELSSPARRALTASLVFCGLPIGGGTVALLTQVFPPDFDWRTWFIIGGVLPMVLLPGLRWLLPETLVPEQRQGPKDRTPLLEALFGGGRTMPTLLLWLTFLPTLLILYLMLNWLPTLVVAKGLDRAVAPQASLAFNWASVAGALAAGWLVDRFGPRWPLTLAYAGLIASLVALGAATNHTMIIAYSGIAGFLLLGANYALYGVAPSYYPTIMRGTGSGASVGVGRVGSILGPLAAGIMLSGGQSAVDVVQYMAPVAAVAGIAVFALSFFRREH
ncbi:MAG TPA: MFS transporter [Steroidobacteraceae bacterium]|nr:MFS transporter [Steroidobacteraceae bacterium]